MTKEKQQKIYELKKASKLLDKYNILTETQQKKIKSKLDEVEEE